PVQGVRSELEQLVLNLVMNACDAMPKGGELTISLKRSAGAVVVLEIIDTGAGIAAAQEMAGRVQSTKRDGAGLGLSIAKAVGERHRGALSVSPVAGGTRAIVMFPTTRNLTKLELRDE